MFGFFKKKKHYQIDAVFEKLPGVSEFPGVFLVNLDTGEKIANPDAESEGDLFLPVEAEAYIQHLQKEARDNKKLTVSLTEKAGKGIKLAAELQKQYVLNKKGKQHPVKD